jgi:hypothetical protein
MMYTDIEELKKFSEWKGSGLESRRNLLINIQSKFMRELVVLYCLDDADMHSFFLPYFFKEWVTPSLMVPEKRLEMLLSQAIELQRLKCIYHNIYDAQISLYEDHVCEK